MINLIQEGDYELCETARDTKILKLDKKTYAWPFAKGIGEMLVASTAKRTFNHRLTYGRYRLYRVKDESKLTDLLHLELSVGRGKWQGYLLPTGLPNRAKNKSRIIPTDEIITYHFPFYELAI